MSDLLSFTQALAELESVEDFLEFFEISYDARTVQVNRLHILQRFHDYLTRQEPDLPPDSEERRRIYRLWLERAYLDFVHSDAATEKVFRVFHNVARPEGGMRSFVSIDKVFQS